MKKFLFLFSILSVVLSSCSSDNDPISQEIDQDPIKYTVNLNVKSAGFEVDKTPLKRDANYWTKFLQVIVYNESGTVYSDTIIDQAKLGFDESMTSISLKLPKGNYYLSILNSQYLFNEIDDYTILANHYETDYFNRGQVQKYHSNNNIYYQTTSLNVTSNSNNNDIIVLEPMWSNIKSLNIKFSPTFKYPAGTDRYITQIVSKYYGFGIKSKLAKTLDTFFFKEYQWYTVPIGDEITRSYDISKAEDKDLYLEICYIKNENYNGGGYITKIQRIKLPIEMKNGMNYTISGTITNVDNIDSGIMSISTEPFKDSNISFQ